MTGVQAGDGLPWPTAGRAPNYFQFFLDIPAFSIHS